MKTYTISNLVILLVFLIISAGCQPNNREIEMIDGVKHIHNRTAAWGLNPTIKLEFVQKIGDNNSTDNNLIMYKIKDVVTDQNDNIYILDREKMITSILPMASSIGLKNMT